MFNDGFPKKCTAWSRDPLRWLFLLSIDRISKLQVEVKKVISSKQRLAQEFSSIHQVTAKKFLVDCFISLRKNRASKTGDGNSPNQAILWITTPSRMGRNMGLARAIGTKYPMDTTYVSRKRDRTGESIIDPPVPMPNQRNEEGTDHLGDEHLGVDATFEELRERNLQLKKSLTGPIFKVLKRNDFSTQYMKSGNNVISLNVIMNRLMVVSILKVMISNQESWAGSCTLTSFLKVALEIPIFGPNKTIQMIYLTEDLVQSAFKNHMKKFDVRKVAHPEDILKGNFVTDGALRTSWVSATRLIDLDALRTLFDNVLEDTGEPLDHPSFEFTPPHNSVPLMYRDTPSSWDATLDHVWSGFLTPEVMGEVGVARLHHLAKWTKALDAVKNTGSNITEMETWLRSWKSPDQRLSVANPQARNITLLYTPGTLAEVNAHQDLAV